MRVHFETRLFSRQRQSADNLVASAQQSSFANRTGMRSLSLGPCEFIPTKDGSHLLSSQKVSKQAPSGQPEERELSIGALK